MSQLGTLIWLKWTLFRNSLRSSKVVINRIASLLAMLAALALALLIALGLGALAYAITGPQGMVAVAPSRGSLAGSQTPSIEFIFFTILAFLYLIWATLPLSIGSGKQFDPGRLLLYPISLRKLFAADFISELTTLQSVFAIPAILALGIGAGIGSGQLIYKILVIGPALAFGVVLSKWLTTAISSLTRKRRTRGETLLALIGVIAGLGGALVGQIAPQLLEHAESVKGLRWTPPGAAAYALAMDPRHNLAGYLLALVTLVGYTVVLLAATYWIARRAALGIGGSRRNDRATRKPQSISYTGWELPLLTPELSAIVEKELRYVMRNAQLRMMVLMPHILIAIRFVNTNAFSRSGSRDQPGSFAHDFFTYGEGLLPAGGVLYVFLILAGLSCNQFAFEEGGMGTLILSPASRKRILLGKNIALTTVTFVFSMVLLTFNELVFRDLTPRALFFAALSFVIFATLISIIGNWLSVRFPKRMKFGKRFNLSGVVGLLLIPMMLVLALPPLAAVAAGYLTQSLAIEYATLSLLAGFALGLYLLVISAQGESLQKREVEILESVRETADD